MEGKFGFFVWDCLIKRLFQLSRKGGRIVKCGEKVEERWKILYVEEKKAEVTCGGRYGGKTRERWRKKFGVLVSDCHIKQLF